MKAFDTLFEPHMSKIRFLKDVLNEITTFGGSLDSNTRLKSLTSSTLSRKFSRLHLHN